MSLRRLVESLRQTAPALDAAGLAEALWLAASAPDRSEGDPDSGNDSRSAAAPDTTGLSTPDTMDRPERPQRPASASTPSEGARSEIRDFVAAGSTTEAGRRIGMQPAPALPYALELARSLRPFKRQWPTGKRQRLDIEATVRAYARTRRLVPVFKPAPERWFDLAFVIDSSHSMAVWSQTLAEFEGVLHQIGAFRHIRSWRMSVDHRKVTLLDTRGQPVGPAQLFTPDGRRLVLILTDGLAGFWNAPLVWQEIRRWAAALPTALVNPLATRLWGHTAIHQPAAIVTPTALGAANPSLTFALPPHLAGPRLGWLPLPTMTLSAHSIGQWARTTIRNDPHGCDALLVPAAGLVDRDTGDDPDPIGPAQAISAIQHAVSAHAFQLAVLCSPFHRMTLQLLNLIRTELTPAAPVSAIAELVVTGVVRINAALDGKAQLHLNEELRPLLQQRLTDHDAWTAYDTLTNYVARHAGQHGAHSVAIPDPAGDSPIPAGMLPFADASKDLLALFYGNNLTLESEPETVVDRTAPQMARIPPSFAVRLEYAAEDAAWAEWIDHILVSSGIPVFDTRDPDVEPAGAVRSVIIVSQNNVRHESDLVPSKQDASPGPLAVYVDDVPPWRNISIANSAYLFGLPAITAVHRLLTLVGRTLLDPAELLKTGARYPGDDCEVFNAVVRNMRFTGRELDLQRLRKELRSRSTVVIPSVRVALLGTAGIGKTQLATEYAHRFRAAYDVVWWINADRIGEIDESLVDLAAQLGIVLELSNAHAILQQLSNHQRRWLLILDNADEPEAFRQLAQYLGHVLITSRNPAWGEDATALQVDVFQRRESVEHLQRRVPSMRVEEANHIAELLGDLPMAIAAAAAWLYDTGTPPEEYIRLILSQGPTVISQPSMPIDETWDLSLHLLRERSAAAHRLFQLCSVFGPEISLELIYSPEFARVLMPYEPAVVEPMVRGSLVQQINRLALARIDQRGQAGAGQDRGGHILVHRVLQHVVRSRMSAAELAETKLQAQQILGASRPEEDVDDPRSWHRFRLLWPHLDVSGAINSDDDRVRRLFIDRVRYQWIQGDLAGGQQRAEGVIATWSARLEEVDTDDEKLSLRSQILHLQFNFANIWRDRGLFNESMALDEAVLRAQKEILPEEHPHVLMTAGGLAGDLRGLGRYQEAMDLDIGTYRSWQAGYGEDHPRTLVALNNLAASHRLMGNFRQARERDEFVYSIRRKVLGETHFLTLATAGNLARDMRDAGEYERSATLLRAVYRSYVDAYGSSTKGALLTQSNLAVSLRSAGLIEEALRLHADAYERLTERFGPTSPDTLNCRMSLSLSLLPMGDYERSSRELQELTKLYTHNLGAGHPHTLACQYNLSIAWRVAGRMTYGLELAVLAAEGLAGALGPHHPYSLCAQMNLAICEAEADAAASAATSLRRTAIRMGEILGPEHPNTLRCEGNVALVERMLDAPDAEDRIDQIITRLERILGAAHPVTEALRHRRFLNRIIDPHPF